MIERHERIFVAHCFFLHPSLLPLCSLARSPSAPSRHRSLIKFNGTFSIQRSLCVYVFYESLIQRAAGNIWQYKSFFCALSELSSLVSLMPYACMLFVMG
jgi:hypothetical protein